MSVFNREHVDIMNEPMFLGSGLGIARYDIQRHQVFEELIEKQLSFFWRPEEISLATDRIQYLNMGDVEKRFFTENLKYQTLLDSIQGRAPSAAFGPIVSDQLLIHGCKHGHSAKRFIAAVILTLCVTVLLIRLVSSTRSSITLLS